jgi:hypothetical protein
LSLPWKIAFPDGGDWRWLQVSLPQFRKGLGETGLVEGKDFTSEMRFAGNVDDRVPAFAVDFSAAPSSAYHRA